ncbi:MAG: Bacterial EndoU nuclease, partial [Thermoleophilia bacterium]|nr:Bacterial EndoU nuclease [Thermoleophilia bacterium]
NTVVEAKGTIKPNSTWRAEVTIDGVKKESTMFPREWSRADVVTAIQEAVTNPTSSVASTVQDGFTVVTGTSRGIAIRAVVEDATGEIVSASPKTAGKAFT